MYQSKGNAEQDYFFMAKETENGLLNLNFRQFELYIFLRDYEFSTLLRFTRMPNFSISHIDTDVSNTVPSQIQ